MALRQKWGKTCSRGQNLELLSRKIKGLKLEEPCIHATTTFVSTSHRPLKQRRPKRILEKVRLTLVKTGEPDTSLPCSSDTGLCVWKKQEFHQEEDLKTFMKPMSSSVWSFLPAVEAETWTGPDRSDEEEPLELWAMMSVLLGTLKKSFSALLK